MLKLIGNYDIVACQLDFVVYLSSLNRRIEQEKCNACNHDDFLRLVPSDIARKLMLSMIFEMEFLRGTNICSSWLRGVFATNKPQIAFGQYGMESRDAESRWPRCRRLSSQLEICVR